MISGEIKHHFRDNTWDVSVPRSLKEDYYKVNKVLEKLTLQLQKSPSVKEIAKELDMSTERVIEVLEVAKDYQSISLDKPTHNEEDSSSNKIESQIIECSDQAQKFLNSVDLNKIINQIPKREQLVVELTYFHDMSQQQIAQRLNMSQIHVSRLLRQALDKLKKIALN